MHRINKFLNWYNNVIGLIRFDDSDFTEGEKVFTLCVINFFAGLILANWSSQHSFIEHIIYISIVIFYIILRNFYLKK